MKMVRLGGGQKYLINSRAQQRAQKCLSPSLEAIEYLLKRMFKIKECIWTGVDRGQGVDQHDLPIEPGKMIAEERTNDHCPVRFVSSLHHRPKRADRRRSLT